METLLKTSYCDSISENRNKSYGQYELRTRYPDRLFKAFLWVSTSITAVTIGIIFFSPELKADNDKIDTQKPITFIQVELTVLDLAKGKAEPTQKPKAKTTPPPAEKVEPLKTVKGTLPFEVSKTTDQKIDTTEFNKQNPDVVSSSTKPGIERLVGGPQSGTGPIGTGGGTSDGKGSGGSEYGTGNITDFPESDPEFEGNLESFLAKSTRYPGKAIAEGIEGQVFVCFIVDENGKVTKPEILKGIGFGCDEEALRVIRNLPDWKPGKMNGHPVKVRMRVPFRFKLAK